MRGPRKRPSHCAQAASAELAPLAETATAGVRHAHTSVAKVRRECDLDAADRAASSTEAARAGRRPPRPRPVSDTRAEVQRAVRKLAPAARYSRLLAGSRRTSVTAAAAQAHRRELRLAWVKGSRQRPPGTVIRSGFAPEQCRPPSEAARIGHRIGALLLHFRDDGCRQTWRRQTCRPRRRLAGTLRLTASLAAECPPRVTGSSSRAGPTLGQDYPSKRTIPRAGLGRSRTAPGRPGSRDGASS
jgi:hypothetical protein